jgi:nitrilase
VKICIVQESPVFLDRPATIAKIVAQIGAAAAGGASLIAFPETYLAGYPDWIWRLRPYVDVKTISSLHERMLASAIDLERDDLAAVRDAARGHAVTVHLGLNERDGRYGRTTLYNTVVTILPTGEIANRHRKLVPTNPERMVWGMGDAAGLRVVETPAGRLGSLICWENYMPLARFALYAGGVELYVAPTWDAGEGWRASMQHIAREGRCWVLGVGNCIRASDMPADLPGRAEMYPDENEWVNHGDSVVVDPFGKIVAGPMHEEQGVLTAEIDLTRVGAARRTLDVVGHYARPDVFRLEIDRRPAAPVTEKG